MVLQCCGAAVLWCCGAVVLWCCSAALLLCCIAVVLRRCGDAMLMCSSVSESLRVTGSHKEPLLEGLAGLKRPGE